MNPWTIIFGTINFFPALGRIFQLLFQKKSPQEPITDKAIDNAIGKVIGGEGSTINAPTIIGSHDTELFQANGSIYIIKQLVIYIAQDTSKTAVVQTLLAQYPDAGDLGYKICRYVASLPPSTIVDANPPSFWARFKAALEEKNRENPQTGDSNYDEL